MKSKTKKIITGVVTGVPVAIGLAGCIYSLVLNLTPKHIVEPAEDEKQKEPSSPTETVIDRNLQLSEALSDGQTITSSATVTDTNVQGTTITTTNSQPIGNALTVRTEINVPRTINGEAWAKFNLEIVCKDGNNNVVWTQVSEGYKQSVYIDTSSHAISQTTLVSNTTISCDKTSINATDTLTLTVNNQRQTTITDACLTLVVGDSIVSTATGNIVSGTNTYQFNVTSINEILYAAGKPYMGEQDAIEFKLVRKGAYNVVDNQLYEIDANGDNVLVSDEDLESVNLKNKFLYKDEYGDLHINTGEITFPKYIQSFTGGKTYEVYLINGSYFSEGANAASGVVNLTIHGLLNNAKTKKLASLRTYRNYDHEGGAGETAYGLGQESLRFTIDHVNMVGRSLPNTGAYLADGMVCPYLECNYCDFTGSYTANTTTCKFKNCTFDTTNTYKSAKKTNYGMWLYGSSTGEFENCTFTSNGKAVKIYYDAMTLASLQTFNFSFKSCTFNLTDPHYIAEYPIDIAASGHTNVLFNVTIDNNCTMNQTWKDAVDPNYIQLYHPNDNTDQSGKAIHIKVNGSYPTVFTWDP